MSLPLLLACGCRGSAPAVKAIDGAAPALQVSHATVAPLVTADPDDPAWSNAVTVDGLTVARYSPKTDKVLPTQVRLMWDKDWLYVRFVSTGPEPYAPFGDTRDALHYQGDVVEVFVDPVGDGRQYFEIQQSAKGGILDQNTTLTTDATSDKDGRLVADVIARDYWPNRSYDMPGLRNASRVVKQADEWVWTADFALPAEAVLKRMGRKQFEPMQLRANLIRYHATDKIGTPGWRLIAMNWMPVKFGCPHQSPAAMGTIELLANPR